MKKLSESVWADIRNKSLGREVREEFKLNELSAKEFKEYIEDQYTVVSEIYKPFYIESTESVSIPICFYKKPKPDYPDYMKDLYVYYGCEDHTFYTWNDINEDIFNILKDNYKTHTYNGCDFTKFSPNDGGDVNNKFVIDVIDFLLKYIDSKGDSFKPLLTKKGINESVWGDLRKKSLGQEDRKETVLKDIADRLNAEYKWIFKSRTDGVASVGDYYVNVRPFCIINTYASVNIMNTMEFVELVTMDYEKYEFNKSEIKHAMPILKKLFIKLKHNYNTEISTSGGITQWIHYKITPKDGSKVTSSFFFEVLDFILSNIHSDENFRIEIEKK